MRRHGVKGAGCFVAEQHFGVAGEGAGDGDALALTAGQLRGVCFRLAFQPDNFQQLLHTGVDFRARHADALHRVRDVLRDRLLHEQVELLENHANLAAHLAKLLLAHVRHVLPVNEDFALRGRVEAVDAADEGALACARETDDAENIALANLQADVVQRDDLAAGYGVDLLDVLQLNLHGWLNRLLKRLLGCFVAHDVCLSFPEIVRGKKTGDAGISSMQPPQQLR